MRDLNLSLGDIANILSLGFLVAIVLALCAGMIADRFGRRLSLILFLSLSALCVGITGFASTGAVLATCRALGFSLGNGLSPITSAYVAEASPPRHRGLLMGLLQCGYPIGWFAASLLAAPLLATYGWRSVYFCAFAVVPVAFSLYFVIPESRKFQEVAAQKDSISPLNRIRALYTPPLRRRTILGALVYLFFGGAYGGSAFYFPTFFHAVRGYDEATAARIVGIAYGIGVFGYIGASLIGEYLLTRRNTVVVWCLAGTCALLALIWLPHTVSQDLVAFSVMATFFYGVIGVLQTFITELFPTHLRATGAALSASAGLCLGFTCFPIIVAKVIGILGWQWGFTLAVAPALLLAGILACALDNIPSGVALSSD